MKWLVYTGPHIEVEVPHDDGTYDGGLVEAVRGKAVEVPDPVAESLLSQGRENADQIPVGEDGNPERQPQHDPTWRTATAKEIAAAQKGASEADTVASDDSDAKGGEQ